jgi:hypothetical protein
MASTGDATHGASECSLIPYVSWCVLNTHYHITGSVLQFPCGLWQKDISFILVLPPELGESYGVVMSINEYCCAAICFPVCDLNKKLQAF